ncbi:MAG: DMT family transporter [Candidatus Methanomethylophilaceae archaeon]|nr:DMT family transporter [Candidatus Methanomethylophilaceae archaeon]
MDKRIDRGYALALTSVAIWSTLAALMKLLLEDIPNLQALCIGAFFAFLFLLVYNLSNSGRRAAVRGTTRGQALRMAGLGFLGLFMYSALYYEGISELTSQEACILNYLWPIMLVLFSCMLLGEGFTVRKGVAMTLSFIGIVVLTSGSGDTAGGNRLLGVVCCIAGAACYGLFSVLNKKLDMDQNVTMMIIWLTTSVCSLALGLATEEWVAVEGAQWAGFLWLGVAINAVAYLTWALAIGGSGETARIANLAYLTPFLSLVVSAVVLGEELGAASLVALVLIIGGILLQGIGSRPEKD